MKLAGCVYAALLKASKVDLHVGKTILQKILFFALPTKERESLYIPFHFGPYSKNIQLIYEQLTKENFFKYDEFTRNFSIGKNIQEEKINVPPEILKRLEIVIEFLVANNITTTKGIAILSKIYFFLSKADVPSINFFSYIKEKSYTYNWDELASLPRKEVQKNIDFSDKLRKLLGDTKNAKMY